MPLLPPKRPHVHREHGVERNDPWYWLRNREDPEVLAWLRTENAHTEAATAHLAPLRKRLYDEMLGRIQEDDTSVPVFHQGFWHYTRTASGKAYAIHCRRKGSMEAPEQVVLDENELAAGKAYFDLGHASFAPDRRTLAYAFDETGRELYELRFRDVDGGVDLPDRIADIWPNVVWATEGLTVFYTRLDESLRPWQVWRHVLGTPVSDDVLVYQEDDERFRVHLFRTRDEKWIFIGSASGTTTEYRYLPADRPDAEPVLFAARHPGHEYTVDSQGERFLVLTNDADDAEGRHTDAAVNFQLAEAWHGRTKRSAWRILVPHRDEVTLVDVDAFEGFYVLAEREGGATWFRIVADDGRLDRRIPMPEEVFVADAGDNPSFRTDRFRFTYTSLTTPPTVFDHVVETGETIRLKEQPIRGGYDRTAYVSERRWATAEDGTAIPLSIVRRRDTPVDGTAPALLYGYGAYGITVDPAFSLTRLSLLDRGVIFAIAHVRGGGFLGRRWKEAGKLKGKQHTFSDFVVAARFLVAEGYTSHDRLAIMGGSAGGLLIGAVLNQAPGLCKAAVAQVPFVDVVTTMFDASLPLTTNEWEEWGDPRDREWFDVMLAYSPYDNVREGPYPDLLVTSGLNDPRVQFWEPTKWVARIRERATNNPQVLLKMELETGHGGKTGRYGWLEDVAFEYAWLLDRWGLADGPPSS